MIGEFKNRVTIKRYAVGAQTAGGGLVAAKIDQWTLYAKVETRSGSLQVDHNQKEWNYDYKITVRYDPDKVIRSSDFLTFGNYSCLIRSVSIENEGYKRFAVLRCSFVEQLTEEVALNYANMVTWYVTDGTEGTTLVMDGTNGRLNLAGQTVTEVNRENYELKPVSSNPTAKEFIWNANTRTITVSYEFSAGEQIKITYKTA